MQISHKVLETFKLILKSYLPDNVEIVHNSNSKKIELPRQTQKMHV